MILSLFLLLALIQSQRLNYNLAKANERLGSAAPITIDKKSGNFKFKSGSAELNFQLKNYIRTDIIPTIEKTIKEKEDTIDFIQVIGYTDGTSNHKKLNKNNKKLNKESNLDDEIEEVANGKNPINRVVGK